MTSISPNAIQKFASPPLDIVSRPFLWSKAWAHRSYRVIEFLEGGSKLLVPAGHVFNPAVIVNWDPCVHGLGMFESRQFKGKFLKKSVTNKNIEKAGGYHMYG